MEFSVCAKTHKNTNAFPELLRMKVCPQVSEHKSMFNLINLLDKGEPFFFFFFRHNLVYVQHQQETRRQFYFGIWNSASLKWLKIKLPHFTVPLGVHIQSTTVRIQFKTIHCLLSWWYELVFMQDRFISLILKMYLGGCFGNFPFSNR